MNPNEIQHGGDHYKKAGNAQHWDMLPHCGFGWEYYIGAATKYATRVKDPENDPKKIVHFIDKLIWLIEQGLVPPEFQTVGGKRDFDFGSVPYSKRVYVNDWLRNVYFPANGINPEVDTERADIIDGLMTARTVADLRRVRAVAGIFAGEQPPAPPPAPSAADRLAEAAAEAEKRVVKVAPELAAPDEGVGTQADEGVGTQADANDTNDAKE